MKTFENNAKVFCKVCYLLSCKYFIFKNKFNIFSNSYLINNMINVGIIGLGKMGKLRYDILDKLPEFCIKLIYDPVNPLQNNIKAHSAEQIIHDQSIDAIFISTPNYLNKELTIASMNAGKHVFCEKPPALSSKDVEDIRK